MLQHTAAVPSSAPQQRQGNTMYCTVYKAVVASPLAWTACVFHSFPEACLSSPSTGILLSWPEYGGVLLCWPRTVLGANCRAWAQ